MGLLAAFFAIPASLALLLLLGLDSAGLFRKKETIYRGGYLPKTLVIVPCKGTEISLRRNLESLKKQKYGKYDLIAVVDSESDESLAAIKSLRIKYAVSEVRSAKASGKVMAIAAALQRFRNYEAYAIADSDITAGSSWLRELVAPLQDKRIGVSTVFPYFVPVGGFWSKVKTVWGFVGQDLLENQDSRFAWGGSMAFRKSLAGKKELSFLKGSKYSVSDDICITMIARRKKLGIAYAAGAQPTVNTRDTFGEFAEWSNRQTALTLLGYRRNFRRGIFFYCTEIFVFLSGIYLSAYASPLFLTLFLHLLVSEKRAFSRLRGKDPINAAIVIIMPFIYVINLLRARTLKKISWRGSVYKLYG